MLWGMNCDQVRKNLQFFGITDTLYDLALRAINRFFFIKILNGMKTITINSANLAIDKKYKHGFLSERELKKFALVPDYELTENFLKEARKRGDQCYGILDGDILVNYSWYSDKPMHIYPQELFLSFSSEYVYIYKAFTHILYRGQNLQPVGKSLALKEFLDMGYKGIVSYVESNNFSSLRAAEKTRGERFGRIYIAGILKRYLIYCDKGCRDHQFRLALTEPQICNPISQPMVGPDHLVS